jgi:hypothetical protein
VALYGVLQLLLPHLGVDIGPLAMLAEQGELSLRNTRGEVTGYLRCAGTPRFLL